MMQTGNIRQANKTDAATIAEIIKRSFQDVAERFSLTPENCPKHPSNYTPERVLADIQRGVTYFLLVENNTPAGAVAIEQPNPETCYLERLSVLPGYRKKGYGEALTRYIFQEAQNRGAKELSISIIAAQTELRQWYEKLGFQATGTTHFDHLPFEVMFLNYEFCRSLSF